MKHLPPVGPHSGAALGPFSGAVNIVADAQEQLVVAEEVRGFVEIYARTVVHNDALFLQPVNKV
jgi:hypothetical protein